MTALPAPPDAELVARVLAADREAFALVYDRYGPRLYDFAYSMLRHREDAADAVADSFVLFAERLSQLRDPDRLRPWLYAIVRSECLRRLKARKRVSYGDDEVLVAMADDALSPEQEAERAALQNLVWDAAAGLADRDRALLDLHLRQGLEGAELGEAMGVTAANAYVMLNRLKGQVDRSLGALLTARVGRDDCEDLDALLVDWDGSFSPLIRKRVARHVDQCDVCGERRRTMLSPWMLLAGVPVFAAPVALRDRVLRDTRLVAYAGPPVRRDAAPGSRTPGGWGRTAAAAAAAALVVAGGAVAFWPDDAPATSPTAVVTALPTLIPVLPTGPTAVPTTSAPTSTTASDPSASVTATPTPTPSTAPVAAPAALTVVGRGISLGRTASAGVVRIGNSGDLPLTYIVTSRTDWLRVSAPSGSLAGGSARSIAVRADRDAVPEGTSTGTLLVTGGGRSVTVRVALTELNAPVVGRPIAAAPTCSQQTVTARVTVTDQSSLSSVRLLWTGPNGSSSASMTLSGGRWVAPMGPFALGGPVTFKVVATDRFGSTTTGASSVVNATPCPG
ncbi:MAG: hypothetical protein JWQ74_91 [Marmoricola sp.]|nr:hypothetical protein [Marmoricola sp.]